MLRCGRCRRRSRAWVLRPVLRDIFRDIAYIEEQLGITLPLPPAVSAEDADAAATIAQVLRTGEGSATFQAIEATIENPSMALSAMDQFATQGSTIETVTYPLFGKPISLGQAEYPVPALKPVKFVALGTTPDAPSRVRFEPVGDGEVTFRLLRPAAAGSSKRRLVIDALARMVVG